MAFIILARYLNLFMYQYIYDSFLSDIEYSKILTLIENRLTDLGLNGRRERLNLFKDLRELIVEGVKNGVQTVVAVGNDSTLTRVIDVVGDLNITLGLLPIGPNNKIAKVLGIPEGVAACDCLSNRLVQKIDLGKINEHYFLSHIQTSSAEVNLWCGNKYCITPTKVNQIEILNLPTFDSAANPQDGYLEARFKPLNKNFFKSVIKKSLGAFARSAQSDQESFFTVKKIFLESKTEASILVDGSKIVNTPVEVQVLPQRLKIIVGKNRLF